MLICIPCNRARRRLPAGFECVSVGSRQIGQLREMGIDYVEGWHEARYAGPQAELDDDEEDEDNVED